MSVVVHLLAGPLAEGNVVGRVEVVGTGEVVTVRSAEDLVRAVTSAAPVEGSGGSRPGRQTRGSA